MTRARLGNVAGHAALALSTLLTAASFCSAAHAQFAADRSHTEGPGIRVGNVEIHPGVAARGGYDTNVYRGDGDGGQPIEGAGILAVTPHFALSTIGEQRMSEGEDAGGAANPTLKFRMGAAATYFQYFGVDTPVKNVALDFDGLLNILPSRPVSLDLGATYTRQVTPFTARVAGGGRNTYSNHNVTPTARLNVQSRGGVFTTFVAFTPVFAPYEGREFKYLSRVQYGVETGSSWKFLPTTALIHDLRLDFVDYYKLDEGNPAFQAVVLSNSTRLQSRLGINGAVTNNVSIRVLAGYAVGFMDDDRLDDYQAPIGEAMVAYKLGQDSDVIEAGYQRSVVPAALGANMVMDRGLVRLGLVFAQRVSFGASAGVGYVTYGRLLRPTATGFEALGEGNETERKDVRIDGSINLEYRVTNWLAFLADAMLLSTLTDFEYAASGTGTAAIPPDPAKFTTLQFFGGVRVFY